MKLTCKVIEDILPLYYDGICSEDSAALVEEHLKECSHCSQLLSDLGADIAISKTNTDDFAPLKKLQKSYQKLKLGWYVAVLCILLLIPAVLSLGVWRLWPQSFSDLLSVSDSSITSISAYGMEQHLENGQTQTDAYRIDTIESPSDMSIEIIEILKSSGYRQDFRNLLPWEISSVGADKNYDGQVAIVSFYTGDQKDDYLSIQFLSSSVVAVSGGGKSGFHIYHPTNHEIIDQLMDYLQLHGVKQ